VGAEGHGESDGDDGSDECDGAVLSPEEGARALLDRGRDLPHPIRAGVPAQDVPRQQASAAEAREDSDGDDVGEVHLRWCS